LKIPLCISRPTVVRLRKRSMGTSPRRSR